MKTLTAILAALLLMTCPTQAQKNTDRLQAISPQAEKFWPDGTPIAAPQPQQPVPGIPINTIIEGQLKREGMTPDEYVKRFPLQSLPPPEFDKPFDGLLLTMTTDDPSKMHDLCTYAAKLLGVNKVLQKRTVPGAFLMGCAPWRDNSNLPIIVTNPRECIVVLLSDAELKRRGRSPEVIRRHEIGHCNGWPEGHPGARHPTDAQAKRR